MKTQAELADIIRQLRNRMYDLDENCLVMWAEYEAETEALIGGFATEVPAIETMTPRMIATEPGKVEVREVQTTMAQDIARQIEQGSHGPEWGHR
jgi:hypothetical protein